MVEKTLDVQDMASLAEKVADVVVHGNPGAWVCLCKASSQSQGWMKSTKVMNVHGGCVMQVSTQQRNPDGSYAVAEALTFLPRTKLMTDVHGHVALQERY